MRSSDISIVAVIPTANSHGTLRRALRRLLSYNVGQYEVRTVPSLLLLALISPAPAAVTAALEPLLLVLLLLRLRPTLTAALATEATKTVTGVLARRMRRPRTPLRPRWYPGPGPQARPPTKPPTMTLMTHHGQCYTITTTTTSKHGNDSITRRYPPVFVASFSAFLTLLASRTTSFYGIVLLLESETLALRNARLDARSRTYLLSDPSSCVSLLNLNNAGVTDEEKLRAGSILNGKLVDLSYACHGANMFVVSLLYLLSVSVSALCHTFPHIWL